MAKETQITESHSRKFIVADPSKCTGCGICEWVCASEKSDTLRNPLASRIRVLRLNCLLNVAIACRFCKDAPCVKACPEKAIIQSDANGVLIVDERKCKGCDWCIQACQYGGLALHPDKSLAIACDLCNGEPKCVEYCPEEALELVSDDSDAERKWKVALDKLPSEIEKLANVAKKKEWSQILAEAEERAKKTSQKLETINKRTRTRWTQFTNIAKLKEVLQFELDSDEKKLAFENSDGVNGLEELFAISGAAQDTIYGWWQKWIRLGLVTESETRKDRKKKIISLDDIGIKVPKKH